MIPFTVIMGAEHVESSLWLRDQLRARGVNCVVLAEPGHSVESIPALACTALATAGISTLVVTDSTEPSALLPDLRGNLTRVLAAESSAEVIVNDLQARGWIPAQGEVYTEDELETVTARLQELGYA